MSDEFESAFRQLLKAVIREVALYLRSDQVLLNRMQSQPPIIDDSRFLLSTRETAKRLSISDRHLFSLTKSGILPCVRVGTRVLYSVETIKQWMRESEASGTRQVEVGDETDDLPASTARVKSRSQPAPKLAPKRHQARKAVTDTEKKPKKRAGTSVRRDLKTAEIEERRTPFSDLLNEIGVNRSSLPPLTNGELRQIAEVDIATFHGWMYHDRELPEAARKKLKEHFQKSLD